MQKQFMQKLSPLPKVSQLYIVLHVFEKPI